MEPNHNHDYAAGSELPQLEELGASPDSSERAATSPEAPSQHAPALNQPASSAQVASVPITSLDDTGTGAAPAAPATHFSTVAITADDADLIEKEWVIKAKAIVMQTKDDPRTQNIQMSGIKADYLKKRYNKDLKVSEN